jgi:hypothetical protein
VGGGGKVRVGISVGNGTKVGVKVGPPGTYVASWREKVGLGKRASSPNEMEVAGGARARRTPPSVNASTMLPKTSPLETSAVTSPRKTPPTLVDELFI